MKISALIEALEQMKAKYGDIPVGDEDGMKEVTDLEFHEEDEEFVPCIALIPNGTLEKLEPGNDDLFETEDDDAEG